MDVNVSKPVVLKLCAVEHAQVCRENILKILKICVFSENFIFFEKPQLKHPKLKN